MKNILIMSSSASFIERNSALLRRSDFKIFHATNTFAGMNVIESESIDLVLVDINVEDMPGEAFCHELSKKPSSSRIALVLVCNDNVQDMEKLNASGADVLLARPVKPLQLIKTVGQFL